MLDLTLLQRSVIAIAALFFLVFYLRRFWFYFWKVNKLITQFDEVKKLTQETNEAVKEIKQKIENLENRI